MLQQPTSDSPVFAALYVFGVFDNSAGWSNFDGWIADIQSSSFDVVIFSTFHVDSNGNLYGNVPLVTNGTFNPDGQLNPQLPALYQGLAQGGKTLLYSIGNSAGTGNDMAALQTILANPTSAAYANLQTNMSVLASELAISGIDFDFEPAGYTLPQQTVVTQFTAFCNALSLGVTYCPFINESWWVGAQIAAGAGSVAWWNLQCYSGGTGNTPANWLPAIQQNAAPMGVSDPAAFIVPGTGTNQNPAATQQLFNQWASGVSGLTGGFIWQFGNIEGAGQAAAYATAVESGIVQASSANRKTA